MIRKNLLAPVAARGGFPNDGAQSKAWSGDGYSIPLW